MLRAFQAGRVARQFLVAKGRGDQPDAIDVAGRHTDRAAQTDKQGIQVSTFAAQIAGLQHGLDIAFAATAYFGLAVGVGDNPVIEFLGFFNIGSCALCGSQCGLAHNAVDRNHFRWTLEIIECVGALGWRVFLRPIHGAALGLHAAGQFHKRLFFCGRKLHIQHLCAALTIARQPRRPVAGKAVFQ